MNAFVDPAWGVLTHPIAALLAQGQWAAARAALHASLDAAEARNDLFDLARKQDAAPSLALLQQRYPDQPLTLLPGSPWGPWLASEQAAEQGDRLFLQLLECPTAPTPARPRF